MNRVLFLLILLTCPSLNFGQNTPKNFFFSCTYRRTVTTNNLLKVDTIFINIPCVTNEAPSNSIYQGIIVLLDHYDSFLPTNFTSQRFRILLCKEKYAFGSLRLFLGNHDGVFVLPYQLEGRKDIYIEDYKSKIF